WRGRLGSGRRDRRIWRYVAPDRGCPHDRVVVLIRARCFGVWDGEAEKINGDGEGTRHPGDRLDIAERQRPFLDLAYLALREPDQEPEFLLGQIEDGTSEPEERPEVVGGQRVGNRLARLATRDDRRRRGRTGVEGPGRISTRGDADAAVPRRDPRTVR